MRKYYLTYNGCRDEKVSCFSAGVVSILDLGDTPTDDESKRQVFAMAKKAILRQAQFLRIRFPASEITEGPVAVALRTLIDEKDMWERSCGGIVDLSEQGEHLYQVVTV